MDPDINNILEPKEEVVWQGIVNRKVLTTMLIVSLIVTFVISGVLFTKDKIRYNSSSGESGETSGFTIAIGVLVIGLLGAFLPFFSGKVKDFAITQKRVLIKSGLIGTDFKSIYFDQIKNVIVDVGLMGKIFNVGSIRIDIGKTETYSSGSSHSAGGYSAGHARTRTVYDVLQHIEHPYEVYKYLQQAISQRKESLYSGRADRESNREVSN